MIRAINRAGPFMFNVSTKKQPGFLYVDVLYFDSFLIEDHPDIQDAIKLRPLGDHCDNRFEMLRRAIMGKDYDVNEIPANLRKYMKT